MEVFISLDVLFRCADHRSGIKDHFFVFTKAVLCVRNEENLEHPNPRTALVITAQQGMSIAVLCRRRTDIRYLRYLHSDLNSY